MGLLAGSIASRTNTPPGALTLLAEGSLVAAALLLSGVYLYNRRRRILGPMSIGPSHSLRRYLPVFALLPLSYLAVEIAFVSGPWGEGLDQRTKTILLDLFFPLVGLLVVVFILAARERRRDLMRR